MTITPRIRRTPRPRTAPSSQICSMLAQSWPALILSPDGELRDVSAAASAVTTGVRSQQQGTFYQFYLLFLVLLLLFWPEDTTATDPVILNMLETSWLICSPVELVLGRLLGLMWRLRWRGLVMILRIWLASRLISLLSVVSSYSSRYPDKYWTVVTISCCKYVCLLVELLARSELELSLCFDILGLYLTQCHHWHDSYVWLKLWYHRKCLRSSHGKKTKLFAFFFSWENFYFNPLPSDPRLGKRYLAPLVRLLLFKYWPGMTSYSSKLNAGLSMMFTAGSCLSSGSISVSCSLSFTTGLALRQTKRKSRRRRKSWTMTRARQRPMNIHSGPVNESQLRPGRESGENTAEEEIWRNLELISGWFCHNIIRF